jgi:predicted ribonuclease YlaK
VRVLIEDLIPLADVLTPKQMKTLITRAGPGTKNV